MMDDTIQILPAWEALDTQQFNGLLMVLGSTDVGKSTFARYLFRRLVENTPRIGYLDGDPGQNTLGPPCTMSLSVSKEREQNFPPSGESFRVFIGSTSPVGHMLPMLTGVARLSGICRKLGVQTIVYDTTGLVDQNQGGLHLKMALIDLLRPAALFAIQKDRELEPLLTPLRRSRRTQVIDLPPSPGVRHRDATERRSYRTAGYARYFKDANPLTVYWPRLAVLPVLHFEKHQLVAFEDVEGFVVALGIVQEVYHETKEVTVFTPANSLDSVDTIRLGNVTVDPETFEDGRLIHV